MPSVCFPSKRWSRGPAPGAIVSLGEEATIPEIVEVEKLRKQLYPAWWGKFVDAFIPIEGATDGKKFAVDGWSEFTNQVVGKLITKIDRLGKALWIQLGPNHELAWKMHLSSTGWWLPGNELARASTRTDKIAANFLHSFSEESVRVRALLSDGQEWEYHDPRTWGTWHLSLRASPRDDPALAEWGPDWIDQPAEAVKALLQAKTKRTSKDTLCDQRLTAGLGNYTACEVLARAGIHPHRRYHEVAIPERKILAAETCEFLCASMNFPDHRHWRVFKRKGQPCPVCNNPIEYTKDGNSRRGSYFCGTCQTL